MSMYGGCATRIKRDTSRRRSLLLAVLVCLVLVACGPARPSDAPTAGVEGATAPPANAPTPVATISAEQVLDIAQTGLSHFREIYSQCQVDNTGTCVQPAYVELGFNDQQELDQATLGPPYQEFLLEPEMLNRYTPGTRVATLITPQTEWLVPVVSRGEGRSAITVESGTWAVVGFGGYQNVSQNLITVHNHYAGQPVTIHVIEIPQVGHHLALITEDTRESLIILSGPVLSKNAVKPAPPEEVMAKMLAELPNCPPSMSC